MKKIFGVILMTAVIVAGTTSCKSKQKVTEISGTNVEATAKTNTQGTVAATTTTTVS